MSMKYIRDYYNVPAKRGMKVRYWDSRNWLYGIITSSKSSHLYIKLDGKKHSLPFHPTFYIEYFNGKTYSHKGYNWWTDWEIK